MPNTWFGDESFEDGSARSTEDPADRPHSRSCTCIKCLVAKHLPIKPCEQLHSSSYHSASSEGYYRQGGDANLYAFAEKFDISVDPFARREAGRSVASTVGTFSEISEASDSVMTDATATAVDTVVSLTRTQLDELIQAGIKHWSAEQPAPHVETAEDRL